MRTKKAVPITKLFNNNLDNGEELFRMRFYNKHNNFTLLMRKSISNLEDIIINADYQYQADYCALLRKLKTIINDLCRARDFYVKQEMEYIFHNLDCMGCDSYPLAHLPKTIPDLQSYKDTISDFLEKLNENNYLEDFTNFLNQKGGDC